MDYLNTKQLHWVVHVIRQKIQRDDLDAILKSEILNQRELKVFQMRWGVGLEKEKHPLIDVAKSFGVTKERIRHIEKKIYFKIYEHHLHPWMKLQKP